MSGFGAWCWVAVDLGRTGPAAVPTQRGRRIDRDDQPGRVMTPAPHRWHRLPLPRKEVIQPHLPVRLPCYDFVPVTNPTFDSCLLAVGSLASGVVGFHDVTGGVYKAREHIHRGMLTRGY